VTDASRTRLTSDRSPYQSEHVASATHLLVDEKHEDGAMLIAVAAAAGRRCLRTEYVADYLLATSEPDPLRYQAKKVKICQYCFVSQ
jgi:hypothetical protein